MFWMLFDKTLIYSNKKNGKMIVEEENE